MTERSTRPYLVRALYDWCTDSGFTPYVAVAVDDTVRVPLEYVKNGEIVLNVSALATHHLRIDNDAVQFHARFGGVSRDVYVPMDRVIAIYARENGQGMAFEAPRTAGVPAPDAARETTGPSDGATPIPVRGPGAVAPPPASAEPPPGTPSPPSDRPRLTRVK
jgi:stringent starvation protein B